MVASLRVNGRKEKHLEVAWRLGLQLAQPFISSSVRERSVSTMATSSKADKMTFILGSVQPIFLLNLGAVPALFLLQASTSAIVSTALACILGLMGLRRKGSVLVFVRSTSAGSS